MIVPEDKISFFFYIWWAALWINELDLRAYFLFIFIISAISKPVAFHACLTTNGNSLGRLHVLPFDRVITDTWEGYIRHSGSYRIPVTGVYVITWVTPVVGNIPLELVINGQQQGRTAPASAQGENNSQTTTGVAVLFLYRRDVVSIRTHPDFHPVGFVANNKWQDSCLSLWRI